MKIYLKEENNKKYIYFDKRFYSLRCELELDYHPELVPMIDEEGIEVDDNEDIRKYIFDYCIKNNIHQYYVEIVGDNYLFDVDDETEKVEAFVEDLLDSDEANVLDENDFEFVDYMIDIDEIIVNNQLSFKPILILRFDTFSLNSPLIIETLQNYSFDLEECAKDFCNELIELFKLRPQTPLYMDL